MQRFGWMLSFVALVACEKRSSTREIKPPPAVVDAGPAASTLCHPPGPGEMSDDESPSVTKLPESADITPWLEERGVTRAAASAWYLARFAPHVEMYDADMVFGQGAAKTLKVGDRREDALVIEHGFRWGWTPSKVLVITVRNKRIVPLLDVGLDMTAMDWPGTHHLDLALDIDPGGMKMVLRDRAPNGTKLVEPPSICLERAKRYTECEHAIAKGQRPEGWCPVQIGEDGGAVGALGPFASMGSGMSLGEYPGEMHDCAEAVPYFRTKVRPTASYDTEARVATAFVERACADRGTWNWKGDRFVKAL